MRDVEVRLLGPVELRIGGLPVSIERVQVRRLLALLAMRPDGALASGDLVEELWPGDLPQSPRAALRVVASRLRGALGDRADLLRLVGDAYQLSLGGEAVDALRFDRDTGDGAPDPADVGRLTTALALWRGAPFGGAHGPPALDREAGRLEQRRVAAVTRCAELLAAAGRHDEAVIALVPMVDHDACDERAAVLLAGAFAATGRRAEALAVLHRARRALVEVHGLDPDGELVLAEQRILNGVPAEPVATRPAAREWLHGRDAEIDALVAWRFADGSVDGARVALIDGPPGIGKSALALAVAERFPGRVVHAHCEPDALEEPLATALMVRGVVATGDARGRMVAFVDALQARVESLATEADPLVVVLDDLQWATEAELRFVVRAMSTPALAHLTVLATSRDEDSPAPLHRLSTRLRQQLDERSNGWSVRLGPLDAGAVRAAYAGFGGRRLNAPAAASLFELSGGVPYLVRAIAATGADPAGLDRQDIADHVRHTVDLRVRRLEPSTAAVIAAAAALGRTVDLEVLAGAAGVELAAVADAVDRGVRAGIVVRGHDGTFRFDHELTRMHVGDVIGPASTSMLHRAAADTSRRVGRDALTVARHVLGAGGLCADADATRALLAGADVASRRGSFAEAARLLQRASSIETDDHRRLEILCARADAVDSSGDPAHAEVLIDEVFHEARRRRWTALSARAALIGRAAGSVVGGSEQRIARLRSALADPPDDRRLRLELAAALVHELDSADLPIDAALLDAIDSMEVDDDTRTVRLAVRLRHLRRAPVSSQDLGDVGRFVVAARQTGDAVRVLEADEMLARAALTAGDLATARTAHADMERTLHAHRWPRFVWSSALFAALFADLREGPVVADDLARRAMSIGRDHGVDDAMNAYSMFRLSVAARHGGLAELEPFIRVAVSSPRVVPAWHAVLAAALVDAGRLGPAQDALGTFLHAPIGAFHHIGAVFAVRAAIALDDGDALAGCVDLLTPWSGNLLIAGAGAACYGAADTVLADALDAVGDVDAERLRRTGSALMSTVAGSAWATA